MKKPTPASQSDNTMSLKEIDFLISITSVKQTGKVNMKIKKGRV